MDLPALPTNITSPALMATYMNDATRGYFWTLILFSVFVIVFISLNYRMDSKDAFVTSAFLSMIISILMRTLGLITDQTMNIVVILAILGIGIIWTRGRTSY